MLSNLLNMNNPEKKTLTCIRLMLVVCFLVSMAEVRGQEQNKNQLAKVIPPSPTAAALMKFADIPVSPYTGVPNIDIPLFIAKSGDITVPVSLSYHAGGIRMNEEASWVGLGWNLNAGGAISRSILDKDDFAGGYFVNNLADIKKQPMRMLFHTDTIRFSDDQYFPNGRYAISGPASESGFYDFEADVFTYNFLGRSGKFIISRKGKIVFSKHEDLKVTFDKRGDGFTVIDEHGFTYLFDFKERSTSSETLLQPVTSWYLSAIRSPKGDEVKFLYEQDTSPTYMLPAIIESSNYNCTPSPPPIQVSAFHYEVHLKQIEFDNGFIAFGSDGERADLSGGRRLNNIRIYAAKPGAVSSLIKEYAFEYSYFNEALALSNSKEFLRLRLDKLTERANGIQLPPYQFTYNFPSRYYAELSGKSTFSIDHWGYFNGVENKTFIPRYRGIFRNFSINNHSEAWVDIPGADRYTRPEHVNIYSLKEIRYPAGGRTEFELEAHDYDELNSINIETRQGYPDIEEVDLIEKTEIIAVSERGLVEGTVDLSKRFGNTVKMTIAFRCSDFDGCATVKSGLPYEAIYFEAFGVRRDITNNELACGSTSPVCSSEEMNVTIASGSLFRWKAYISPGIGGSFQEIRVVVKWTETRKAQHLASETNHYSYAGGLRVKQVTDYDQNNDMVKQRRYNYHFEEDSNQDGIKDVYSRGRRMSPPSYFRYETVFLPGGDTASCRVCKTFIRTGTSNTSLSSSAQGSIVGYDKVQELVWDPASNMPNGKTEYKYENKSDRLFDYSEGLTDKTGQFEGNVYSLRLPGMLNLYDNKNGLLKEKIDYGLIDGQFVVLQRQTNFYRNYLDTIYYNIRYGKTYSQNCQVGWDVPKILVYPAVRSERIVLDSTITILFERDSYANSIKTVQRNYYESMLHTQPSKTSTTTSDGKMMTTVLKYSLDAIKGLSASAQKAKDDLVSRHIIAPVLEQTIFKGNTLVSRTRNNYKLFDSGLVLPENIELQTGKGSLEKRVEFQQYDDAGNLVQQAKTDDVSTVYLWGYGRREPIAQITNATYRQEDEYLKQANHAGTFFGSDLQEKPLSPGFTLNHRQKVELLYDIKAFGGAEAGVKCYLKNSSNATVLFRDYQQGVYADTLTLPADTYTLYYVGQVQNATAEPFARFDIQVTYHLKKSYPNIFYAGFEEDVTDVRAEARTGRQSHYGIYTLPMPRQTGDYILSFWEKPTSGNWQYKEERIAIGNAAAPDKEIGAATSLVDEVRLYPVGAQMTTYTYDPLIGLSSVTDANNMTTYYEYDALSRLKLVKDEKGNILNRYDYQYAGQPPKPTR